jgi:hypothetical protein
MNRPEFKTVTCYRLSKKDEAALVEVNPAYIVSCERAFQGGDSYAWVLTMCTGQQYFISQDDYLTLYPSSL